MIRILVDSREQRPFRFLKARCSVQKLDEGDYRLYGDHGMVIERKSVEDLFHTVVKDTARFERELARLTACHYPVLLVEGLPESVSAGARYSGANGSRVLDHTLRLCVKYGVAPVFCYGRLAAEDMAWRLLKARHEVKTGRSK